MPVSYINRLLASSSPVFYIRDICKEMRTWLFLLLLSLAPGLTAITTATQHSVTDGGAQRWHCLEPKKKSNRKCLVWMRVCNCNLAESKHGELEQNTYLNAVHWA